MSLLYYRLTRAGIEVTSEVVCQKHYDEFHQPGGVMAPLSENEIKRRYAQTVVPYTGDRPCATCEEERETRVAADTAAPSPSQAVVGRVLPSGADSGASTKGVG